MVAKTAQRAGVYLASANWQHITYLVALAAGLYHYVTPALAAVIVPALAHHWVQALVAGRQALAQAAREEWLRILGYSEEQAEQATEEKEDEQS
jgi:hypothetical protein